MSTETSTPTGDSFGVISIVATIVGLMVFAVGLLLVPESPLGGGWIAAIGLSLALSGLFAAEWVCNRIGLSTRSGRRAAVAFAVIAVVLLVAFVVVNYAGFESNAPITDSSGG